MRSTVEFLGHLRAQSVALTLDGDALKCSAPPGVLTAELREELGRRKPEIVAFLRASQQARQGGQPAVSQIERIDRSGPLPLSLAQLRLWFLNQLDSESPVYNIGVPIKLTGKMDVEALERALAEIVQRHEDLRTSFIQVGGEPRAVIGDGKDWKLKRLDARALDELELHELAAQQSKELFDIARGPLFRAALLQAGDREHVLVLTMHHMISDGWSLGVLVNEFAELYRAYCDRRSPSLHPLAIQYVDFAAWQRKWLESGELDRQLPYWKKQLAGAPPVVGFPADHRRPQTEMFRGRRLKLVIPRDLVAALEQLSQSKGVTFFMTLLAAFKALLARYCGQDDIVVGSPSANRSRAELSPLIGFFVNNLVLRTDLEGNPSFTELLARVREVTLRAYEHQDVPFDRLVQTLRPERSLDHSPLFQVMFIMQNFPMEDLQLSGLVTEPLELDVTTARFDLTVEVFPRHGELWAYFDYNSDLYEPETIASIQRHYVTILEAVCADPHQRIGEIPLLSATEQTQLVVDWNQTAADNPECCFHEQFAARASAHPDRVAVMAGAESLTYRQLDERANRFALALQSRGAARGKLVALCLGRSADLVAGMIAIAKCGAAYVPLDPAYPRARIVNIFEDAMPVAVLTSENLRPLLPQTGAAVICVEETQQAESSCRDCSLPLSSAGPAASDELAYVIFTSGSTGRPKGVEITHRSLVNFLESMRREPGFSDADVLLAVTTVSFDIAGLELLLPLYTGGTVCVAQDPANPAHLLADLARYRPTVMQATPATWKLLIAAGWRGDPDLTILCGGEALDPELARSLVVRSGSLWNMYGPTETTIWSSALRIEEAGAAAIPVGRPIQNTSFFVLDALRQPVPLGVAGELWIGGDGVARGYLNRPELTEERFVSMAFAGLAPARLYRTGDLVRYRGDGTLDFLGRVDHQVKLRGFRIELGEIENALRSHPSIADSVTQLREVGGDKRLVAYVVVNQNATPAESDLRDHLRAVLPEYMVPASFVFLSEFPRLPNGKLDRAALPAPDRSDYESKREFVAPAKGLQQNIAAAFRNVLQVEKVGLDDNFFDLGAHSLQIVKVHADLHQSIETKVPLISFFQYPTIRALAGFIEQQSGNEALASAAGAI
jgi:amino acid adenylation domain-containing protein